MAGTTLQMPALLRPDAPAHRVPELGPLHCAESPQAALGKCLLELRQLAVRSILKLLSGTGEITAQTCHGLAAGNGEEGKCGKQNNDFFHQACLRLWLSKGFRIRNHKEFKTEGITIKSDYQPFLINWSQQRAALRFLPIRSFPSIFSIVAMISGVLQAVFP